MIENIIRHRPDGETTEVVITRKNGDQHVLLLDTWLWPLLENFHYWVHETRYQSGKFYAATSYQGKLILVHRLVLEPFLTNEYPEVDHVEISSTLDCRVENLRVVNRFEQMKHQERNHESHTIPTRPHYRRNTRPPLLPGTIAIA